jgi:DNA-binding GntR family transcriptional regulator
MSVNGEYEYLKPKRGSRYQQLFYGRIRAEVLYRETVAREPLTPEEIAREYNVPLDAVREAIDYCVKNKELLDVERAREEESV